MTQEELHEQKEKHKQDLRKQISDPSEATMAVWKMEDKRDEMLRNNDEAEASEALEPYTVKLISEVRIR